MKRRFLRKFHCEKIEIGLMVILLNLSQEQHSNNLVKYFKQYLYKQTIISSIPSCGLSFFTVDGTETQCINVSRVEENRVAYSTIRYIVTQCNSSQSNGALHNTTQCTTRHYWVLIYKYALNLSGGEPQLY